MSITNNPNADPMPAAITPAQLVWCCDDKGREIPVSAVFDDVYFSVEDGIAESHYVFIEHNQLATRFAQLLIPFTASDHALPYHPARSTFTIGELGFGTGLNMLLAWLRWQQVKEQAYQGNEQYDDQAYQNSHHQLTHHKRQGLLPRLHLISTEKYPLTPTDLHRCLHILADSHPQLLPLAERLLALYPPLIAGCHRLHLAHDVTLDLWFGDALDSLSNLSTAYGGRVDAWFLDGFAPACNVDMWQKDLWHQLARLSCTDTSFATFSCAGMVRRGLSEVGFSVQKVKGYGRKREMLIGTYQPVLHSSAPLEPMADTHHSGIHNNIKSVANTDVRPSFVNNDVSAKVASRANVSDAAGNPAPTSPKDNATHSFSPPVQTVAVIGAGIAGLMTAWALAQRGITVTLVDRDAPLAGASGNPRALLAPKLTPIKGVATHLHSLGYVYAYRLYPTLTTLLDSALSSHASSQQVGQLVKTHDNAIFARTGALDLLQKSNVTTDDIHQYPEGFVQLLQPLPSLDKAAACLPEAGLVNPAALAELILTHPNITFRRLEVSAVSVAATGSEKNTTTEIHTDTDKQTESNPTATLDNAQKAILTSRTGERLCYDAIVIATAAQSHHLHSDLPTLRQIKGQLSWCDWQDLLSIQATPSTQLSTQALALLHTPLKYGGYSATFTASASDNIVNLALKAGKSYLLMGATFERQHHASALNITELELAQNATAIAHAHQDNRDKLMAALYTFCDGDNTTISASFPIPNPTWGYRIGIRAQTPDYQPIVGALRMPSPDPLFVRSSDIQSTSHTGNFPITNLPASDANQRLWTMVGMGSKGFAFAPLCAEVLADMMTGQIPPLPSAMLTRLSPYRRSLVGLRPSR